MKTPTNLSLTLLSFILCLALPSLQGAEKSDIFEKSKAKTGLIFAEKLVSLNFENMDQDSVLNSGTLDGYCPIPRGHSSVIDAAPPKGADKSSLEVTNWADTERSSFTVPPMETATITFWMKPLLLDDPTLPIYMNIIDIGVGNLAVYVLGNSILVRMGATDTQVPDALLNDEWVHCAITLNAKRNFGEIFVNGELKQTFDAPEFTGGLMAISATMDIAAANYKGLLNTVTIYDSVLSEKEIQASLTAKSK